MIKLDVNYQQQIQMVDVNTINLKVNNLKNKLSNFNFRKLGTLGMSPRSEKLRKKTIKKFKRLDKTAITTGSPFKRKIIKE